MTHPCRCWRPGGPEWEVTESSALLHEGKRHGAVSYSTGQEPATLSLPRATAQGGIEVASEPWTRTHPNISPQAPGHRCLLKFREKHSPLLDTAHRISGLRKNLWEQKVRPALELATDPQQSAPAQPAVPPRGLCVGLPGKKGKKQAQKTGKCLQEMPSNS